MAGRRILADLVWYDRFNDYIIFDVVFPERCTLWFLDEWLVGCLAGEDLVKLNRRNLWWFHIEAAVTIVVLDMFDFERSTFNGCFGEGLFETKSVTVGSLNLIILSFVCHYILVALVYFVQILIFRWIHSRHVNRKGLALSFRSPLGILLLLGRLEEWIAGIGYISWVTLHGITHFSHDIIDFIQLERCCMHILDDFSSINSLCSVNLIGHFMKGLSNLTHCTYSLCLYFFKFPLFLYLLIPYHLLLFQHLFPLY